MKIIGDGNQYQVYSNGTQTYDELPAGTYNVMFSNQSGYFLEKTDDLYVKHNKIYGNELIKLKKVLKTYKAFNKSLGVILSGDKGTGKTLFLQILSDRMIHNNIPVILVTHSTPGISHFIDSIKQEVMVVFDEFEKTFHKDAQVELLGLFDGTSSQKRLYAVTVNDIYKVSEYMLDRPGRFYYNLSFDYPTVAETKSYLSDNIKEKYNDVIDEIATITAMQPFTYDTLSAIAFEINQGYGVKETMHDLNISQSDETMYTIKITLDDNSTLNGRAKGNLFTDAISLYGYSDDQNQNNGYFTFDEKAKKYFGDKVWELHVSFSPKEAILKDGIMQISGEKITSSATIEEDDGDENKADVRIKYLTLKPYRTYGRKNFGGAY